MKNVKGIKHKINRKTFIKFFCFLFFLVILFMVSWIGNYLIENNISRPDSLYYFSALTLLSLISFTTYVFIILGYSFSKLKLKKDKWFDIVKIIISFILIVFWIYWFSTFWNSYYENNALVLIDPLQKFGLIGYNWVNNFSNSQSWILVFSIVLMIVWSFIWLKSSLKWIDIKILNFYLSSSFFSKSKW